MSHSIYPLPRTENPRKSSLLVWRILYVATAILSGVGLLGKASLLKHLLPLPAPLLFAASCVGVCLPLLWPLALRFRSILSPLTLLGLLVASLFVFPRVEKLHSIGRGTDQPDCVIVAANAMVAAQWPYKHEGLWSRHPMSCGPGWVAIQAPVVTTLGYNWNLVAVWTVSLAVCVWMVGWSTVSAVLALLFICPGFWLVASDGSDFLPFGIALAALCTAVGKLKRNSLLFILAAAVLAQFRLPMLLLPAFFAKQQGKVAALSATVLAIASQVAFLAWNPTSYVADGPMHVLFKLTHRHLFSTNPTLAVIEIAAPSLLLAIAVCFWEERTSFRQGLLVYLYAVLFLPAILDLITKIQTHPTLLKAVEFWEGGGWLTACLPLAALLLVLDLPAISEFKATKHQLRVAAA